MFFKSFFLPLSMSLLLLLILLFPSSGANFSLRLPLPPSLDPLSLSPNELNSDCLQEHGYLASFHH